jgi:hypothetical protein
VIRTQCLWSFLPGLTRKSVFLVGLCSKPTDAFVIVAHPGKQLLFGLTGPICARALKSFHLIELRPRGHHDWPVKLVIRRERRELEALREKAGSERRTGSPLMYYSTVTELGDTEWRAVLGLSNHSSSCTERKLFL